MYSAIFILLAYLDVVIGLEFVESPPAQIVLAEGGTLSLTCSTQPPGALIKWYFQLTVTSTKYELTQGDSLVYPNVEGEFEGLYSCSAELDGEVITSVKTALRIAYMKDQFLKVPSQVYTVEGSTVEFECTPPQSYPDALVTWEKDRQTLSNSRSYIKDDYSLVIVGILTEDSGNYQCVASNPVTLERRLSLEGELYVTQMPDGEAGVDNSQPPQPSIESYLSLIEEGDATSLLCGFQGLPYPTYDWYFHNGTEVPHNDTRFSFQYNNQVLEIHPTTRDMSGVFVCQGSNIAGNALINVTLFVNYTEELGFTAELPAQITVQQYSNEATVRCRADGSPPLNIRWYAADNVLLSRSHVLVINTTQVQNITVECRAKNRDGVISQSTNIVVEEREEESNDTNEDMDRDGATVDCYSDRMVLKLTQSPGTLSKLQLLDRGCSFEGNSTIETPLDGCGTQVYYNSTHIIYKNQVSGSSEESDNQISRGDDIHISFECIYPRTGSTGTVEWDAKGKINVDVKGIGVFTFTLDMYTDEGFTDKIQSKDYPVRVTVQDNIFLEVALISPDDNLSITINDIVASDSPDGESGTYSYSIVDKGCIKDTTFQYVDTESLKKKRFTVKAFHFLNSASAVYIHTFVKVCNLTEHHSCVKVCGITKRNIDLGRIAKRNLDVLEELDERSKYHIFQGPFIKSNNMLLVSRSDRRNVPTLVLLLAMAVLFSR